MQEDNLLEFHNQNIWLLDESQIHALAHWKHIQTSLLISPITCLDLMVGRIRKNLLVNRELKKIRMASFKIMYKYKYIAINRRRKWHPTPIFLPEDSAAAAINTESTVCNCSSPDASSKQYHSISFDENQSLISISVSIFFATPWTVAHWAPLSMGFSRHWYWSELPCRPPGDLPNPEIKARYPALQADSSPSESPWKHLISMSVSVSFF